MLVSVQNENGMAVEDRVAFALTFLSDNKLNEYLKKLSQQLIEEGKLAGFLLTGKKIIHFFERYKIWHQFWFKKFFKQRSTRNRFFLYFQRVVFEIFCK